MDVRSSVVPEDAFEPEIYESGNRLKISENWHGHSTGSVYWTITVPPETEVSLSSASGDLSVTGLKKELKASAASGDIRADELKGKIEIKTASGDIRASDCSGDIEISAASGDIDTDGLSGDIELSAASGDVEIRESEGEFDLGTASGDIRGSGLTIGGYSTFSAASGDVSVRLASATKFDMELSTASGNISLDYNGQPMTGLFDFDSEEEFEHNGQIFEKKTIIRNGETPKVFLHTASGRVTLKK